MESGGKASGFSEKGTIGFLFLEQVSDCNLSKKCHNKVAPRKSKTGKTRLRKAPL